MNQFECEEGKGIIRYTTSHGGNTVGKIRIKTRLVDRFCNLLSRDSTLDSSSSLLLQLWSLVEGIGSCSDASGWLSHATSHLPPLSSFLPLLLLTLVIQDPKIMCSSKLLKLRKRKRKRSVENDLQQQLLLQIPEL